MIYNFILFLVHFSLFICLLIYFTNTKIIEKRTRWKLNNIMFNKRKTKYDDIFFS